MRAPNKRRESGVLQWGVAVGHGCPFIRLSCPSRLDVIMFPSREKIVRFPSIENRDIEFLVGGARGLRLIVCR